MNESAFTPEAIIKSFRWYLKRWGNQEYELACYSEQTTLEKCSLREENLKACDSCDSQGINRLDKYIVELNRQEEDDKKRTILNFYTNILFQSGVGITVEPLNSVRNSEEVKKRIVSWLNNNLEKVSKTNIKYHSGVEVTLQDGWEIKETPDSLFDFIIHDYLQPTWIKIEPRSNAYIGRGVLNKETGIDEAYLRSNGIRSLNDVRIQQKENDIIRPRITEALNNRLGVFPNNAGGYCIPYDDTLLRKLKAEFYTPTEEENSSEFKETNVGFMSAVRSIHDRYCAPKYESDVNLVTKLPFMWCRGKECFKTSLDNQTLVSCESWERYTILHILEILGFPQITHTSGGNEASDLIRNFIGMVNKASSLFKRVRCRECNHLLFPLGQSNFNRYNNFECRLPSCGNRGKRVYLSQCHQCKTGLIDSRDSARCPHGWHICPKCLSCCDDNIYERMASKYILKNQSIPPRISVKLGHGHNDKGEYFCPKCGGRIVIVHDEHSDRTAKVCQVCRAVYAV